MKTLLFFRHGKSDWNAEYQGDHERPVSKRGQKAARRMGNFLKEAGQVPQSIITSSALRARSTVEMAAESGGWNCPVRVTDALYESSPEILLSEIRDEPDEVDLLMVAGHEPVWSETISRLAGGCRLRFPTAAVARIDLDADSWKDVRFGEGTLIWLVTPKLLKS